VSERDPGIIVIAKARIRYIDIGAPKGNQPQTSYYVCGPVRGTLAEAESDADILNKALWADRMKNREEGASG